MHLIIQIELITQIISLLINHITDIKKNIRFFIASDRDALLTSFKQEKLNLFYNQLEYYLVPIFNPDNKEIKEIVYLIPEEKGKVWYDEIIRIADIIAGTIADWNLKTNKTTHPKFIDVINKLLNPKNTMICRIETHQDKIFAERIKFKKIKKYKISNTKAKLKKNKKLKH